MSQPTDDYEDDYPLQDTIKREEWMQEAVDTYERICGIEHFSVLHQADSPEAVHAALVLSYMHSANQMLTQMRRNDHAVPCSSHLFKECCGLLNALAVGDSLKSPPSGYQKRKVREAMQDAVVSYRDTNEAVRRARRFQSPRAKAELGAVEDIATLTLDYMQDEQELLSGMSLSKDLARAARRVLAETRDLMSTSAVLAQQLHITAAQEALWRTGLADARSVADSLEARKNGEAWYRRELARCGEEWTLRLPEEDERTALRIVTEYEHSRVLLPRLMASAYSPPLTDAQTLSLAIAKAGVMGHNADQILAEILEVLRDNEGDLPLDLLLATIPTEPPGVRS